VTQEAKSRHVRERMKPVMVRQLRAKAVQLGGARIRAS